MRKRIAEAVLAAAVMAAVIISGTTAADAAAFSDVQGSPYRRAIEKLAVAGVLVGFPDGTFKPDQPVTRLDAVEALARGLGLRGSGPIPGYADLAEIPEDVRPAIAALLNTGAAAQRTAEVKRGAITYALTGSATPWTSRSRSRTPASRTPCSSSRPRSTMTSSSSAATRRLPGGPWTRPLSREALR